MKEKAKKQKKVIIIVAVIFIMIFLLALCSEESDTNASDPATDKQGIKNEEKFLEENLEGYKDYKSKVRYRLIPFIW